MEWVGYKVHLTETCDPETPHLIVNVETTPASTPDDRMVAVVHASLAKRDRLPTEHWVDKGYTDAQVLLDSQRNYQVTITGPVAEDPSWQARAGTGFDKAHFAVNWDGQVVTCPSGKQSISWLRNPYPKNGVVWEARFARQDCTPCPFRARCTHAKVEPRIIGLQTQNNTKSFKPLGSDKPPNHSGSSTRRGPISKAPMDKRSGGVGYAVRAISAWPKPIYSISSRPQP